MEAVDNPIDSYNFEIQNQNAISIAIAISIIAGLCCSCCCVLCRFICFRYQNTRVIAINNTSAYSSNLKPHENFKKITKKAIQANNIINGLKISVDQNNSNEEEVKSNLNLDINKLEEEAISDEVKKNIIDSPTTMSNNTFKEENEKNVISNEEKICKETDSEQVEEDNEFNKILPYSLQKEDSNLHLESK